MDSVSELDSTDKPVDDNTTAVDSSDQAGPVNPASAFKTPIDSFAYRSPTKATREITHTVPLSPALKPRRAPRPPSTSPRPAPKPSTSIKRPSPASTTLQYGTTENSPPQSKRRTSKPGPTNDSNPPNKLIDSLEPGLILVLIGLNPGLQTAQTGHAYAHRSNLYWPLLHDSGITPQLHKPSDTHSLPRLYRIGNTNQLSRPTRDGSTLTLAERLAAVPILGAKIAQFKPEAVAIVGKGIWEDIFLVKKGRKCSKSDFRYGWQDEKLWLGRTVDGEGNVVWPGARTFVTTTTSALAAGMSRGEKLEIWRPLGEWVGKRREELKAEELKAAEAAELNAEEEHEAEEHEAEKRVE